MKYFPFLFLALLTACSTPNTSLVYQLVEDAQTNKTLCQNTLSQQQQQIQQCQVAFNACEAAKKKPAKAVSSPVPSPEAKKK